MTLTPEERSAALRTAGRVGGYTLHSRVNSVEHLAPARSGFMARFEREVDPDGELPHEERAKRAHSAMRAHMSRLAMRSARARAAARQGGNRPTQTREE